MWPHVETVAKKCLKVYKEAKDGKDIKRFQTNGSEDVRMNSSPKRNTLRQTNSSSPDPKATQNVLFYLY